MSVLQGAILGLVQGLTEFLPISSTAHLRVVPALCGWDDPGAAFSAVVQLGTLFAVLAYFRRELWGMARAVLLSPFGRADRAMARLGWMVVAGTVPIGVAGLLLEDVIETSLRSLWVVAAALVVLALVMVLAEIFHRANRPMGSLGWPSALAIGLAQVAALVPGASRSGVTITAGLLVGLERSDAARFSFLLSVPAVAAAGLYEGYKLVGEGGMGGTDWAATIVATLVAAVSGYAAIAGLLGYLKKRSLAAFAIYRILLGGAIVALVATGVLTAH